MSREIIDIIAKYTVDHNYPLMIIASRNQVDYNCGYVCTSKELAEQVSLYRNQNLLLCRDHCGPYFSDLDQSLSIDDAIIRCKNTIAEDISAGFDLIHIDVSRIKENQFYYASELIDYAISLNSKIKLEFGSEDNTGIDINSSIGRIDSQLEFLKPYKDNIVFFVSQTGSLTKDSQTGVFDILKNTQIKEQIHLAGFLFKEHNADYFTKDDINQRIQAGIDSLNIAPQLGKIQTDILKDLSPIELWQKFSDLVYSKNYWKRWVAEGVTDQNIAVSVSGHYCFNSDEYRNILAAIDATKFNNLLSAKIIELLEFYKTFDNQIN